MNSRLRPGDPAPPLAGTDTDGAAADLDRLRGRNVIVYFFPKAFTPGCTAEACSFRDSMAAFADLDFTVIGVSGDTPQRLAEFRRAHRINHDLWSDPDHAAARAWAAYGAKTVDGAPTVGPLRSTFVLDPKGVVRLAEYGLDPTAHVPALLEKVRCLPVPSLSATHRSTTNGGLS